MIVSLDSGAPRAVGFDEPERIRRTAVALFVLRTDSATVAALPDGGSHAGAEALG